MKKEYLSTEPSHVGAECAGDGESATAVLQTKLAELNDALEDAQDDSVKASLLLDIGHTQLELEQKDQAWENAHEAWRLYTSMQDWEGAVAACNVIFYAEQSDALIALGHGVWLGVTYPINPELTVTMLQHVVEETPPDADGGAVAAATAYFIADVRAQDKQRDNLLFFTNQMLGQVARRHSQVETQAQFEFWLQRLELSDPEKFLPRLGQVVDVLVSEHWWIDRDALRDALPEV
jgi:hypothetical protein